MFGMTPFGLFHTLISLVAVVAGGIALFKHREIGSRSGSGRSYVYFTAATCVTGLFIFHHGGFGKPHALAIITLAVLAVAYAAERMQRPGSGWRYVSTLGYLLTLYFHVIPGFTETATRIPAGHPLVASPDDPRLQAVIGVAFLPFLYGGFLQVKRLRAAQ